MNKTIWSNAIVTKIALAMYVPANHGTNVHNNRPFHGIVFNESGTDRNYSFGDGTVLNTPGDTLFYLPKGSSYRASENFNSTTSGCFAINFDMLDNIADKPFAITFRNTTEILRCFRKACDIWRCSTEHREQQVISLLYDIIVRMQLEFERDYFTSTQKAKLLPAIDMLHKYFTDPNLTVSKLAKACEISEVYLRRLFLRVYGVSPKQYLTNLRISYAKDLLKGEHLSVTEVASACGYIEASHFSREFKRICGYPPSKH